MHISGDKLFFIGYSVGKFLQHKGKKVDGENYLEIVLHSFCSTTPRLGTKNLELVCWIILAVVTPHFGRKLRRISVVISCTSNTHVLGTKYAQPVWKKSVVLTQRFWGQTTWN